MALELAPPSTAPPPAPQHFEEEPRARRSFTRTPSFTYDDIVRRGDVTLLTKVASPPPVPVVAAKAPPPFVKMPVVAEGEESRMQEDESDWKQLPLQGAAGAGE